MTAERAGRRTRIVVTGGTGALGRVAVPLLRGAGHQVLAPARLHLDVFDPQAVAATMAEADAVLHLATRIPAIDAWEDPDAWIENDRLRRDASRILVEAALASSVATYVQPTVAFVYPPNRSADERTPLGDVASTLRSALDAEAQTARFAAAGRRGVVLRLGLLDGPGTGNDRPDPRFGATLHVEDAAAALRAALGVPSGVYNVCRDGERVSNARFREISGWGPRR
jgi:nucleoside-diphosphate-sugar epimerase